MSEQIIVLSPGPANAAGSFDQIHQGTYLGGETRMQAAVELSRLRRDAALSWLVVATSARNTVLTS
jgi:hypothetical protein